MEVNTWWWLAMVLFNGTSQWRDSLHCPSRLNPPIDQVWFRVSRDADYCLREPMRHKLATISYRMGLWSSGMIHHSHWWGPGFDSRWVHSFFFFIFLFFFFFFFWSRQLWECLYGCIMSLLFRSSVRDGIPLWPVCFVRPNCRFHISTRLLIE